MRLLFKRWFHNSSRHPSTRPVERGGRRHDAGRSNVFRPRLESLEERTVPSATQFFVFTPATVTVGAPTPVTVIPLDASNHMVPNFTGTVQLSSTGTGDTLPASYTFTASDHGIHAFTLTPAVTGADTITATDSADALTGSVTPTVTAAATATQFFILAPKTTTAGSPTAVTVIALSASNRMVGHFTGTVQLSSTGTGDTLPASYTFTASDHGMHTFMLTPAAAGTDTVTAADSSGSVTGAVTLDVLGAPTATHIFLLPLSKATAGSPARVDVIPLDATNHIVTRYTGTVQLSSTGTGDTLPAAYTFQASDHGMHVLMLTPAATGTDTVTATDTASSISGSIALNVTAPRTATHFFLNPVSQAVAGSPTKVNVISLDATNHIVTGYTGTVQLSSTGTGDTLPAAYTFQASDHGMHMLTLTPAATGTDTVTATDTGNSISGSVALNVTAVPTAKHNFVLPLFKLTAGSPAPFESILLRRRTT